MNYKARFMASRCRRPPAAAGDCCCHAAACRCPPALPPQPTAALHLLLVQEFTVLNEKYADQGLVIMAFPCNQVRGATDRAAQRSPAAGAGGMGRWQGRVAGWQRAQPGKAAQPGSASTAPARSVATRHCLAHRCTMSVPPLSAPAPQSPCRSLGSRSRGLTRRSRSLPPTGASRVRPRARSLEQGALSQSGICTMGLLGTESAVLYSNHAASSAPEAYEIALTPPTCLPACLPPPPPQPPTPTTRRRPADG